MTDFANDQQTFMTAAGQTTDRWNMEQGTRYAVHLQEEARELMLALSLGDHTKALDGAIDSIVVALGFVWSLGIDPRQAWEIVNRKNASKVDGSLGPIVWRADGQVGKPPGWTPPEPELAVLIEDARRHTR